MMVMGRFGFQNISGGEPVPSDNVRRESDLLSLVWPIVAKSLGDGLAIFRVVDVDEAPLPGFFAVYLGFYTVGGNC
jgi:hypothetical protein